MATVADDLVIADQRLRIGLSIGVAIYPMDGIDAATLIGNADAALYRAKSQGRATICFFESDMDRRLRERRALQHELRSAIRRDELALYYQPQARVGGEIIGFEALVRWNHPGRGLLAAGSFIPIARKAASSLRLANGLCVRPAARRRPGHAR
jgi:predicted signal transduction protein with EAL and GGDEF domain